MYQILQATYREGSLILDKKLSPQLEDQVLQVIVFEVGETKNSKEQFLEFAGKQPVYLPEGYVFNRDELYRR